MGRGQKRRRGGKRPPAEGPSRRYLRPRLPDGTHGKLVPIEFYPRYSTMVGDGSSQDLLDVSAYRLVTIPSGPPLRIEMVETDDANLGWDGRAAKRGKSDRPRMARRLRSRASTAEQWNRKRRTGQKRRQTRAKGNGTRRIGGNEG